MAVVAVTSHIAVGEGPEKPYCRLLIHFITVRVTLTYADTLTKEGGLRVVIRVLYAYCQSYSDLRGYSDKGGIRVVIRVLYVYCQSYSGVHGGQLT